MTNREIAMEILNQLGGFGKLRAMISAKDFVYGDKNLSFGFKGSKEVNKIKIQLNEMDLYDITFYKYMPKKVELKEVIKFNGLWYDQLKPIFEDFTGLDLSL